MPVKPGVWKQPRMPEEPVACGAHSFAPFVVGGVFAGERVESQVKLHHALRYMPIAHMSPLLVQVAGAVLVTFAALV